MNHKKKLFIAIDLPGEVKDDLYTNACEIEKFATIRKTPPDNFHLTLLFIGESEKEMEISKILKNIESKPFVVEFDGIGEFKKKKGDVIWQGVKNNSDLSDLYEKIYTKLIDHDIIKTDKNFLPHITLGRKFKLNNDYNLDDIKKDLKIPIAFYVRQFHLFESKSTAGKLIYEILDTFYLDK